LGQFICHPMLTDSICNSYTMCNGYVSAGYLNSYTVTPGGTVNSFPTVSSTTTFQVVGTDGCSNTDTAQFTIIYCGPVGIDESNKHEDTFSVYPDPCHDKITLSNASDLVQVFNLVGELMLSKTISSISEELDISILPEGVYIIKNRTSALRLVKE
jgi:hypothetical protein